MNYDNMNDITQVLETADTKKQTFSGCFLTTGSCLTGLFSMTMG